MSEDFVTVWEFDLEKGVRQRLVYKSLNLDCFLFRQKNSRSFQFHSQLFKCENFRPVLRNCYGMLEVAR